MSRSSQWGRTEEEPQGRVGVFHSPIGDPRVSYLVAASVVITLSKPTLYQNLCLNIDKKSAEAVLFT